MVVTVMEGFVWLLVLRGEVQLGYKRGATTAVSCEVFSREETGTGVF